MKYYMAPMEGLTGYIYRNAYQKYFHDIDRYFTPFITNKKLDFKVKKDIDPEHNQGMEVVPQILTNQPDDFISIVNQFEQPVTFLGDGVPVFQEYIAENCSVPYTFAPAHVNKQRAGAVAALGMKYFAEGRSETAAEHKPEYLRLSQAERERKEGGLA